MSEQDWLRLGTIVHQVLVLLDDWICDKLGLSRKGKGKYAGKGTE